jgi:hypothetical protein
MHMKWLFLVHQLQSPRSRERVMVWRSVQKIGAVLYRNSVYALPYSKERLEDFQWLCQQIRDVKGEASVFVSEASDRKEDAALRRLFSQRTEENYSAVLADAGRLQARVERAKTDRRLGERLLRALEGEAHQLTETLGEVRRTDFFDAPAGREARRAVEAVTQRLSAAQPQHISHAPPRIYRPREFQGRTWATRKRIHIDRLCSAWLIGRFVDRKARFVFAPESKLPKDAIPYDVFGVEFSHHGEDCTFETFVKAFQLKDPALRTLAEIVHDIDMKDGKFGRAEAAGLDLAVRALGGASRDDHETLKAGTPLLDALHRYLATAKPKGTKR